MQKGKLLPDAVGQFFTVAPLCPKRILLFKRHIHRDCLVRQFLGKRSLMHIDPDADYNIFCLTLAGTHLCQNTADLFAMDDDIIGPLDPGLDTIKFFNGASHRHCSHQSKTAEVVYGYRRSQQKRCGDRNVRRCLPLVSAPAPACRLLSGRNDKPFRLAGYRTALDLIVGRINTL